MSDKRYRMLLVEDNPADARLIVELLQERPRFDFEADHAVSLEAAYERLERSDFDVVLLDLSLPDSTGLDTVTRTLPHSRRAAIVVLTGLADEELSDAAIRLGAQGYLLKSSLHPDLLTQSIRHAHERKTREVEREEAEQRLRLLNRLTRSIAEAPTFHAAVRLLLEDICKSIGWTTGESWIVAPDEDRLVAGPNGPAESDRIRRFHAQSEGFTFRKGEGLPGQVWETAELAWEPYASRSPRYCRTEMAMEAGLSSAVMVPVMAGTELAAVLAFYHSEARPEDRALEQFFSTVAGQLGTILLRLRAEDALRTSEQWRRHLMETANDGICVLAPDGSIQYINERGGSMLGATATELAGRSLFDFLAPASGAEIRRRIQADAAEGRDLFEVRLGGGSGTDLWVLASTSPIAGSGGDVEAYLAMFTDITQLKTSERTERVLAGAGEALSSSLDPVEAIESLASKLVPEVADWCVFALHVADELRVVASEAADPGERSLLQGYSLQNLLEAAADDPVASVLRTGRASLVEDVADGVRRDYAHDRGQLGILRPLSPGSYVIVPLDAPIGVSGVMILARSRSSRRLGEHDKRLAEEIGRRTGLAIENARLYQEATRAVRARDELLGVVAHDLRNPLSAVSMYASMLEEDRGTSESRRSWIGSIRRSVLHMDRLIQDLLDVTRIETGRLRVAVESINAAGVLAEIRSMFESAATERGIHFSVELGGGDEDAKPLVFAGDRMRIVQILSNLIGNALKFTPSGGSVSVRAEAGTMAIRFSVHDTGSGIPAEQLSLIFDRFWQADDAPKSGVGLGLTIAKGLVEAHGGTIWAESAPESGTAFHFTIPRDAGKVTATLAEPAAAATPVSSMDASPNVPRPTRTVRVLIADDHEIFLNSLEEILRATGRFEIVGKAHSGEEALDKARTLLPDLVVMDLRMAGRGGVWAIRELAAMDRRIPILALTADAEEDSLLPAMEAGASGYVLKTATPELLLRAIETVLDGGVALNAGSQRMLAESFRQRKLLDVTNLLDDLAEQERQILTLVAAGYTSREIGKRLYLSPKTVDTYRSRLMRDLNLEHRSDLVRFALKTGLLRPNGP